MTNDVTLYVAATSIFLKEIRWNHLFLFLSESFDLDLLWGALAVPDLEMLSSLRRLLRKKKENQQAAAFLGIKAVQISYQ